MAFSVTPTSGASPYFLEANVIDSENIDGINYSAEIFSSQEAGSCPSIGNTTALGASFVADIVNGESVNIGASSVPGGSCRTYTLSIIRLSDSVVVASSSVSIDNV